MTEPATLCGETIGSRRGLLASLWSLVTLLTAVSFLTAFIVAMTAKNSSSADNGNYDDDYFNDGEGGGGSQDEANNNNDNSDNPGVGVTSRALAFSALWTGVLASLMSVFGTVILGWQSPTGQYYTCCSSSVHRTTPLGLGSFVGALLMLSNLTLICAVLFGDFQIRDNSNNKNNNNHEGGDGAGGAEEDYYGQRESRSALVFSILCIVLTVLYAGFAALIFAFARGVIDEHNMDERGEAMMGSRGNTPSRSYGGYNIGYDGYIGDRFDVGRPRNSGPTGFVSANVQTSETTIGGTMA